MTKRTHKRSIIV